MLFCEVAWDPLLPPYLLSGALRILAEVSVSFVNVPINSLSGSHDLGIIAIVDDSPRHATEN
jgi:hypothetical protein